MIRRMKNDDDDDVPTIPRILQSVVIAGGKLPMVMLIRALKPMFEDSGISANIYFFLHEERANNFVKVR